MVTFERKQSVINKDMKALCTAKLSMVNLAD